MEDAYIIKGGVPLRGEVKLSGAKNVALKAIIGALLFDSKVVLHNVPHIVDVIELTHLIKKLGVKAAFTSPNTLEIDPSELSINKVDLLHASKLRASFMLFAPLLQKFGKCFIPNPGGCRLGERSIGNVIDGMKTLGVEIEYDSSTGYYTAQLDQSPKGNYTFPKPTHTGTEVLIMLAAIGHEKIVLENCALEPEIDHLIRFLNEAGARIERRGKKITVQGVESLKQEKPFTIASDRNEAVTFAVLAIASKGDILVRGIDNGSLDTFLTAVRKVGGGVERESDDTIRFWYKGQLKPMNIQTTPHPGFMTDWQPNWAVLMLLASGDSMIHERVFENRFAYVDELKKLGADIEYIDVPVEDPKKFYYFNYDKRRKYVQAIRIKGSDTIHGGVLRIADLRAGASLAIASLIAQGESVITGASILERGYENFVEKVTKLRGQISKI